MTRQCEAKQATVDLSADCDSRFIHSSESRSTGRSTLWYTESLLFGKNSACSVQTLKQLRCVCTFDIVCGGNPLRTWVIEDEALALSALSVDEGSLKGNLVDQLTVTATHSYPPTVAGKAGRELGRPECSPRLPVIGRPSRTSYPT